LFFSRSPGEYGADVDKADEDEVTALHFACRRAMLLWPGCCLTPTHADKGGGNGSGVTALYFACSKGHVDVVKLLLEHGAGKTEAMNDGRTPLDIQGNDDIVKLLLSKHGAKRGKSKACGMSSEALAEAASKADAVMAALLEEEEEANGGTKKTKKAKTKKQKKKKKKSPGGGKGRGTQRC